MMDASILKHLPATRALESMVMKRSPARNVGYEQKSKRTFDLTDIYQSALSIGDNTFPSIEWCNTDDEEDSLTYAFSQQNQFFQRPASAKRRKRHLDEAPYLVRSRALNANLVILGSSTANCPVEVNRSNADCTYTNSTTINPFLSQISVLDHLPRHQELPISCIAPDLIVSSSICKKTQSTFCICDNCLLEIAEICSKL